MRETAATIFARFQSDRARVESRQTTHSGLRTAQRTGAAASRPRRAIHGDAVSLSPVLQACGVRQFKYAPGLGADIATHTFVWTQDAGMIDLGTLGGTSS